MDVQPKKSSRGDFHNWGKTVRGNTWQDRRDGHSSFSTGQLLHSLPLYFYVFTGWYQTASGLPSERFARWLNKSRISSRSVLRGGGKTGRGQLGRDRKLQCSHRQLQISDIEQIAGAQHFILPLHSTKMGINSSKLYFGKNLWTKKIPTGYNLGTGQLPLPPATTLMVPGLWWATAKFLTVP